MNTVKSIYVFVQLAVLSLLIVSCGSDKTSESNAATDTKSTKTQSVEVVKPTQRSFVAEVLITGTAEANQQVTLYAMESGYVLRINKDIGDYVRKGEVVAALANPELQRKLEERNAQLVAKKSIYERLQSTYEKTPSLTPLQLVEEARAEYFVIKANVKAIMDRIDFLSVKAPFSGVITNRMVDVGALVQSGLTEDNPQGIVVIQEFSPIRLTIPLPESDIAAISKGMKAIITFPELPGKSYEAEVSRTSGALDPASKTMRVEIDIDNSKGLIKPGMYAKALMQINSREGVVSLPVTAQWMYQNQPFIMVVTDNKVERIPLRKGLSNKDYFEVLNSEITETSLVITQGKGLVSPGQIVQPVIKSE